MFFSLCFLLALASHGFSGVQSYGDRDGNDDVDGYGARSLSAGFADDYGYQRADAEAPIDMVNEGMDKVVALASSLVEGTTPVNKRSGVFLAAAKPEIAAEIQEKLKDAQVFAEKVEKVMKGGKKSV